MKHGVEWKLSVSHLIIFGCVAYAHVPEELGNKFDDISEKCIFVGYSAQSKTYKLYNPITKKEIISRDVKFIKDQSWNDQVDGTNRNQQFPHAFKPMENSKYQETTQRFPRLQVQGKSSNQRGQALHSPSSSSDTNPMLASLRN